MSQINAKEIVSTQRKYFFTHQTKSYEFRKNALINLKTAIKDHEAQISQALHKDLGKSNFEAYATEIGFVYEEINYTIKHLKDWMRVQRKSTPTAHFKSTSHVYKDPYGVTLVIAPWNYPFQLTMGPLIGAISGGNTVVIKPSEFTPHTTAIINQIISKTFRPEFIQVVEGAVEETKDLLDQKWDYIFFTGSTNVGRVVMKAASEHLTPVTLELGGKCPCIVDSNANIEIAAKRIIWGKFLNAGQTCIAPDYILVENSVKAQLIKSLKSVIEAFYGKDPKTSSDYTRIVNEKHMQRLAALMKGGEIIHGGDVVLEDKYIAPTLIDNVDLESSLMKEEIFGPLLPIIGFNQIDDAIDFVNDRPKPLALYVFTDSQAVQDQVLSQTSSGGSCINDTVVHIANPNLPFGGVGESGMGNYHGQFSFDTFTHDKAVLNKSIWPDVPLRYAPYQDKTKYLKFLFK